MNFKNFIYNKLNEWLRVLEGRSNLEPAFCVDCGCEITNQDETPFISLQVEFGDDVDGVCCDKCAKVIRDDFGSLIQYERNGEVFVFSRN